MSLYCLCLGLWYSDGSSCAAIPTGTTNAANRYTTVLHIHVRDFMVFSSLLREWRFRLARSGGGYRLAVPPRQKCAGCPTQASLAWVGLANRAAPPLGRECGTAALTGF